MWQPYRQEGLAPGQQGNRAAGPAGQRALGQQTPRGPGQARSGQGARGIAGQPAWATHCTSTTPQQHHLPTTVPSPMATSTIFPKVPGHIQSTPLTIQATWSLVTPKPATAVVPHKVLVCPFSWRARTQA